MELAKNAFARQQLELLIITQNMDRPLLLPPGVPAERVKELRAAFDATLTDPAFRADAQKMRLHLDPVTGDNLARDLASAYALPADVVAAAKETMGGSN
jgi:tripartite-type tricarboxylate transporter receptor subunit TctC